ncbi:hypothetical protein AGMMS4952_17840 [Spirochaetia bacterium]|nr:hypothetical protein AGMMS4952_17840 [Spirochaetia bacterium]
MDAEDKAVLRRVAESNEAILAAITKPDKSAKRIVEIITLGATISGLLSAIDLIKNWLGG